MGEEQEMAFNLCATYVQKENNNNHRFQSLREIWFPCETRGAFYDLPSKWSESEMEIARAAHAFQSDTHHHLPIQQYCAEFPYSRNEKLESL